MDLDFGIANNPTTILATTIVQLNDHIVSMPIVVVTMVADLLIYFPPATFIRKGAVMSPQL